MYSLDFQPVAQLEQEERWGELATLLVNTAKRLERAGADFWLVASNTLHSVVGDVRSRIGIPFLHIADADALLLFRMSGFIGQPPLNKAFGCLAASYYWS